MTQIVIPRKPSTGGRPALALSNEVRAFIEEEAEHSSSAQAIAIALGISDSTFLDNKDFSECYQKARAKYLLALHRAQHQSAFHAKNEMVKLTGQVWLGKQDLGQSDKRDDSSGPMQVNIIINQQALPQAQVIDAAPQPERLPSPDSDLT